VYLRSLRVHAIVSEFRLDATLTTHFNMNAIDQYMQFGFLFELFEAFSFKIDGGILSIDCMAVVPVESHREIAQGIFDKVLGTAIVLVSSKAFIDEKALRNKLVAHFSDIADQARSLKLNVNEESEFGILSHSLDLFEDSNAKEALRKSAIREKVLTMLNNQKDDRTKYYNFACILALFGDYDACKKYLRWTFNMCDGRFKEVWHPNAYPTTRELIEGLYFDEDFSSVRGLDWFQEAIAFAEQCEKEEIEVMQIEQRRMADALGQMVLGFPRHARINNNINVDDDADGDGNGDGDLQREDGEDEMSDAEGDADQ